MTRRNKVAYYYDSACASMYYGQHHPMKPHRLQLVQALVHTYGLTDLMETLTPAKVDKARLASFHDEAFLTFLEKVSPYNATLLQDELERYFGEADCPVVDNLYDWCQRYTGASVGGAVRLNYGLNDVVVNWSGGLHHAKKQQASGFCYINDINLAILELLKFFPRVLYVDIDIHHGDGVEEAFLTSDRVMTVSFHKFGSDFFPGTGNLRNIGRKAGRHYSVNVPLKDGIDDRTYYEELFRPIMQGINYRFDPSVVVLQSGADSLAEDRLGAFNLTIRGHAQCQQLLMSWGKPMLVLGGGGYSIANTARCWAYETATLVGGEPLLQNVVPNSPYNEYFGPQWKLHIHAKRPFNQNTRQEIETLRASVLDNLRNVYPVSCPIQEAPPEFELDDSEDEDAMIDDSRDWEAPEQLRLEGWLVGPLPTVHSAPPSTRARPDNAGHAAGASLPAAPQHASQKRPHPDNQLDQEAISSPKPAYPAAGSAQQGCGS